MTPPAPMLLNLQMIADPMDEQRIHRFLMDFL